MHYKLTSALWKLPEQKHIIPPNVFFRVHLYNKHMKNYVHYFMDKTL